MQENLSGKIALITGASRGIGKAIALHLANMGATVIGTATTDSGVSTINSYLHDSNAQGVGLQLDVKDFNYLSQFIDNIKEKYGQISILINNAGITRDNLALRMQQDQWQEVIDTNLTAVFNLSKLCLRDMLKMRYGKIVNITSVVALIGNPGQANYVASKAGVIGLTKSLALEAAPRGININAVAPGFIATDMTHKLTEQQQQMILQNVPMRSIGTANDVANVVGFLVTEAARYITGQTIHVNGGLYMCN